MSDLFGNHIVGFPTRRLNYLSEFYFSDWLWCWNCQNMKLSFYTVLHRFPAAILDLCKLYELPKVGRVAFKSD